MACHPYAASQALFGTSDYRKVMVSWGRTIVRSVFGSIFGSSGRALGMQSPMGRHKTDGRRGDIGTNQPPPADRLCEMSATVHEYAPGAYVFPSRTFFASRGAYSCSPREFSHSLKAGRLGVAPPKGAYGAAEVNLIHERWAFLNLVDADHAIP